MDFLDMIKHSIEKEKQVLNLKKVASNNNIDNTQKQQSFDFHIKDNDNNQETRVTIVPNVEDINVYKHRLKQVMIDKIKKQWLTPNPDKKYFAVTDVIGCPLQVYLRLSGEITEDDIEEDKIFYLLEFYARMGDTVHDQVYKHLEFQHKEKFLYDKENRIRGKFDIIDNGVLIDIKSSQNESDHSPQLSLYYHLAKINGYQVNRAAIWYVLKDKIVEYDIEYIKSLIPIYLDRARVLRQSLETRKYPSYVDENHCKYCLLQNKCKEIRSKYGIPDYRDLHSQHTSQQNDVILEFDIQL